MKRMGLSSPLLDAMLLGGAMLLGAILLSCSTPPPPASVPKPKTIQQPPLVATSEAWRSAVPPSGEPSAVAYPATSKERLSNGVELYFIHRPSAPTVDIQVVIKSNVSALPVGKSGLAAVAARMMTEGTLKRSALELQVAAESLGSELEQSAERDAIKVGMDVLPGDVKPALTLLAEVVREPGFRKEDLMRVKTEWQDQLQGERQNPMRLAQLAALRAVLGPQLGAPVAGSPKDIANIERADLVSWHKAQVTPTSTVLVVVGAFDPAQLLEQVSELFGKWSAPAAKPIATPTLPAPQGARILIVHREGSVQSALFALQPFPKRSEAGHEAREVMTSLFGGLFTSRLNMNLREEHAYTYGARATLVAARQFGLLALSTSVEQGVTAEAIRELLHELKALRDPALNEPIKPEEIQRAKADLANDLGASLEHTGRIAGNVAHQVVHELPLDYFTRYPSSIAGLSAQEVGTAAQLVDPTRLTLVVVGDRTAIQSKLEALGLPVSNAGPELLE